MDILHIITIQNIDGIGRKTTKYILENYNYPISSASEIFDILCEAKSKNRRIKIPSKEEIYQAENYAQNIIDTSINSNIHIISYFDKNYPKKFKEIEDPPSIIYVKGNIDSLNNELSVAIIGTREPSEYGLKVGKRLSNIFTQNEFIVISGLAKGCDTIAHEGCLEKNGITIAILAHGLEHIYPKENTILADKIIEKNGCLVSEYPIGTNPNRNYFIERDRLQSALSLGVIVIETDIEGGTMHTVNYAIKQNRKIAALNSHPEKLRTHPKFQGNIKIIKEGGIALSDEKSLNDFISLLRGNIIIDATTLFNEKGQGELF